MIEPLKDIFIVDILGKIVFRAESNSSDEVRILFGLD